LPPELKSRTIVDYDDVASSSLFDRYNDPSVGLIKRTIAWANRFLLKRYEIKCLNLGAGLFCSQSDMEKIRIQKKIQNAFVVPNVYSNQSYDKHAPGNGYGNGNSLLFVGTLNYLPNIKGLTWFVNTVFEEYLRVFNDGKLVVVGRKPTEAIKNLCNGNPRIELYANVPDMKPYYEKCKAVVVPLLAGSGTRIKILEAAMMERPVLSTPTGAAGLDLRDGSEIHLFKDAKEFIAKYQLLDSLERYKRLVTSANAFVETKYGKENFKQSFGKVLKYITTQSS
jgi:glycosyltransferase involved in cell wall biosynthesis